MVAGFRPRFIATGEATYDRAADEADPQTGRRIGRPVLVLWVKGDDLGNLCGDPLAVWRAWADDVRGGGLACGHYLDEGVPDEVFAELRAFPSGGV